MRKEFALGLLLLAGSAHAELYVPDYLVARHASNWEGTRLWVLGLGEGYMHANTKLKHRRQAPFYCQPPRLAMTADNYVRILDDYIEEQPKAADLSKITISLMMLEALEASFPCK